MEKQAHAAQLSNEAFTSTHHFLTNELKFDLIKDFLFPHPSPHYCLISDELHIEIMVSWPMTLKVDFLQFERHSSVNQVKTQNTGSGYTHQHNLNQSNGLTKLHEISVFLICCISFCAKYIIE